MNIIELKDISKTYVGNMEPAVNAINLNISKGTIVTLLGPSGCGKTTTLRLIAGFERPETGSIRLNGRTVTADTGIWIPPERRGVGMVFQDYALFPHLTILENVAFGLRMDGRAKRKRINEVLELVGLSGLEKRYPLQVSGGQQQRVALARALAPQPVVVLLDEPFSNLDAELKKHVRQEVREILNGAGTTAIFVTHDQKDALAISDRLVVMKDGRIEQDDVPFNVYRFPATEFVASFVGQANIIPGILSEKGNMVETVIGQIPFSGKIRDGFSREVKLSIRPESIRLDPQGFISGTIKKHVYAGNTTETIVVVKTRQSTYIEILMYLYPHETVHEGEEVRFHILPQFVSIIA